MRILMYVVGLLLIGAGAVIGFARITLHDDPKYLKRGGYEIKVERQQQVPRWLGGYTALTGLAIVLLATRYRR
jgi:hypothetical protein